MFLLIFTWCEGPPRLLRRVLALLVAGPAVALQCWVRADATVSRGGTCVWDRSAVACCRGGCVELMGGLFIVKDLVWWGSESTG
jgi:hypothetical protein